MSEQKKIEQETTPEVEPTTTPDSNTAQADAVEPAQTDTEAVSASSQTSESTTEAVPESATETEKTEESSATDTTPEEAAAPVAESTETPAKTKKRTNLYIGVAVVLIGIFLAALFFLEKEGRSSTNLFGGYFAAQEAATVVAVVNGFEIVNGDLSTSIEQFTQAAIAQGIDVSIPDIRADIRVQSLEVLINTQLLKEEAERRGIEASPEQAEERLNQIVGSIGGEEVLAERMEQLGMEREQLQQDIQDEIMIEALLQQIFAEAEVSATEEEVLELYEIAGGAESLPELEEVRPQVEAQIIATKEQNAIDAALSDLRAEAEIEIVE